jgi:hypothetical protein
MKTPSDAASGIEASCVLIQFSFPSDEMVPDGLNWVMNESLSDRHQRKEKTTGFVILERQKTVCVSPFVEDLYKLGYLMVSATVQNRVTKINNNYNVVRFIFRHQDNLSRFERNFIENVFCPNSLSVIALNELSKKFFWRVRGFSNPSRHNSSNSGENYFWSINPESCSESKGRMPMYYLTLPEGESPRYVPRNQFITRR